MLGFILTDSAKTKEERGCTPQPGEGCVKGPGRSHQAVKTQAKAKWDGSKPPGCYGQKGEQVLPLGTG